MRLLLLLYFSTFPFAIWGQLSLKECWDKALKKAPMIQEKAFEIQLAGSNYNLISKKRLPVVDGQYSNIFNLGRSIDPYSNQYLSQSILGNNFGLSASYSLFNGGQIKEETERSSRMIKLAGYALSQQTNEIKLQTLIAYTGVLLAQENINLLLRQKEAALLQLGYFEKLNKEGRLRFFALETLRTEILDYELRLIASEEELNLARVRLSSYTIIPFIEINNLEPILSKNEIRKPLEDPVKVSRASFYTLPEVRALQLRQNIKLNEWRMARARRLPEINAIFNMGTTYSSVAQTIENNKIRNIPYMNQLWGNMNMATGLVVRIPIFNKANFKENENRIEIEQKLLNTQLESTKLQVRTMIEEALLKYKSLNDRSKALEKRITALKNLFDIASLGFQEGRMELMDFLQSKRAWEEAVLGLNRLNYETALQEKILGFYQTGEWQ